MSKGTTGKGEGGRRAVRHPLVGLLLLAALVRFAFFLETHDDATFTVPLWDSAVFDEMARSVARGDGVGYPKAYFFGPLYAYLLGFIYFVTGNCSACAVVLQHLLGVLVSALTYALGRTWFGRKESLVAAALVGLSGVQVFYEGKLLMEVWISALILGAILILARADARARGEGRADLSIGLARAGLAGLLIGLAALGRPTALLLAPLCLVPLVRTRSMGTDVPASGAPGNRPADTPRSGPADTPRSGLAAPRSGLASAPAAAVRAASQHESSFSLPAAPRSGVLRRHGLLLPCCVFLIGLSLPATVTLIRNHRAEGVWLPISSSGGFNFYLGNARDAEGMLEDTRVRVDSSWNGEDTAEADLGRQLDSAELSRYWFRRVLKEVSSDPLWSFRHYLEKFQTVLGGQDIPQIECYGLERERSQVLRWLPFGLQFLAAGALAGMALSIRNGKRLLLLYGTTLLYVAGVAAFFVTTRYRVVALPYFALFSAVFLVAGWKSLRRRSWKRLLLLLVLAGAAWAFTLPGRFPVDHTKSLYALRLHDGFRLTRAGEYARAEAAYLEAQRTEPEDYEGYLGLGIAFREQGDLEGSLRQLEAAMQRNRDDAEVPYHLGVTLHKMRLYEGAERAQRRSLALSPRRALTHAYLGVTLAAEGRFVEARAELETSLELDPDEPFTHNNLGALLGVQEDHEGARRSFLRALQADPEYIPARRNLAQSYLEAGDTDSAVRELRRVLSQDPEDGAAGQLLRSILGDGSAR